VFFLIIPAFLLTEGRYLFKHPKTFSWPAAFVWLLVTGFSFIFVGSERTLGLVPLIHVVAIALYYFIKLKGNM